MGEQTFEVPIMLSTDNLTYEDIAKLNPFYEEYNAFWATSLDGITTAFTSDDSSRTSSLKSIETDVDALDPFNLTLPPLPNECPSGICIPDRLRVSLRNGKEYKPVYNQITGLKAGHVAIVESEEQPKHPLSPIPEYYARGESDFLGLDYPYSQAKTSHKKLFGQNGWLGGTAELEAPMYGKSKSQALKGLGKKLKQHVEDLAGDMAKAYASPFHASRTGILSQPTIPISLGPEAQAKLYSEMEVMICVSVNNFLVQQYQEHRLSKESIKKINNYWGSKNRPQVVEFQFDQATQRRLILSNIRHLNFNGESSTNPVLLHSNLQNWKAIVKEMGVRTFCAPDSVIRKHMHDIYKILDMLGAPTETFVAFQDLQMKTLSLMKDHLVKSRSR